MSDSRNWSSTRDGFIRSVSTSSSSSISTTASGMNASLTEAQSYSREARRAEELANRLESQASFFEGNSAAGSLNLSQAYREWGLAEIERNRDFYGNVRFDDVTFQLSPEGQALQAKFIEELCRAASRRDRGSPRTDPGTAVCRARHFRRWICSRASLSRWRGSLKSRRWTPGHSRRSSARAGVPVASGSADPEGRLDAVTKGAQGASAEAADDVKEW
jgi:conjugal transfer mating pair stabilization protein TraG